MKVRTITIEPVLNGFVVHVGCQRVVIASIDELSFKVGQYYKDPGSMENAYIKARLNNTISADTMPCEQDCAAPIRPEALRGPAPYTCESAPTRPPGVSHEIR